MKKPHILLCPFDMCRYNVYTLVHNTCRLRITVYISSDWVAHQTGVVHVHVHVHVGQVAQQVHTYVHVHVGCNQARLYARPVRLGSLISIDPLVSYREVQL